MIISMGTIQCIEINAMKICVLNKPADLFCLCMMVRENLSNYSFDFSAMTLLAYLSPHSHHKITINA